MPWALHLAICFQSPFHLMQVLELELQKLQLGKQLKLWLELEPSEPLKAASQALVQPMPLMGPTSLQGLEQLPLLALLVAQLVAQLLVAPVVVARLVTGHHAACIIDHHRPSSTCPSLLVRDHANLRASCDHMQLQQKLSLEGDIYKVQLGLSCRRSGNSCSRCSCGRGQHWSSFS